MDQFLNLLKHLLALLIKLFRCKSKGLSEQSIRTPITIGNGLDPRLNYIQNSKIQVKFDGSYLIQEKLPFAHEKCSKHVNCSSIRHVVTWFTDWLYSKRSFVWNICLLTKNADPDKYSYSKFGIQFDL